MAAPLPNPRVPFSVAHEDGEVLVVVKDRGVVTQPGRGHERDSLLNGLVARYGERNTEYSLREILQRMADHEANHRGQMSMIKRVIRGGSE